jgi:hypothetical protein
MFVLLYAPQKQNQQCLYSCANNLQDQPGSRPQRFLPNHSTLNPPWSAGMELVDLEEGTDFDCCGILTNIPLTHRSSPSYAPYRSRIIDHYIKHHRSVTYIAKTKGGIFAKAKWQRIALPASCCIFRALA